MSGYDPEDAWSETLAAADPPWSKHEEEANLDAQRDAHDRYWSSPAGIAEQIRLHRQQQRQDIEAAARLLERSCGEPGA